MRDRLIELINQINFDYCEECVCASEDGYKGAPDLAEFFADRLIANGVIVPPCKVGDTVYITLHPYTFLPLKKVVEGDVVSIHKHEWGLFIRVLFDTKKINGCADYEKRTWGERLFFTREEAEKELDERSKK